MQKELVGPYQLLKAGVIDQNAGTITLPLYKGKLASGEAVWYILTDTNDLKKRPGAGLKLFFQAGLRRCRPRCPQSSPATD